MRILFIENRYSTLLWREAAAGLEAAGHEVHWMVQNHLFRPPGANVTLLPYPSRSRRRQAPLSAGLQAIARTDRALRYFGIQPDHYTHYQSCIDEVIARVSPGAVFGEATQFHELMTIANCKAGGIPFVAPNSTRYPVGRLVFLKDDSFEPVGGSGDVLCDQTAAAMLQMISSRSVRPSYMAPPQRDARASAMRTWEQMRIALGWFQGERFITPAPWRRIALDREHAAAMREWERLAVERDAVRTCAALGPKDAWVLYPLQLQPESNIDMYGQPWNDQRATMARAADALATIGARLIVKPNPKSKYEMNRDLTRAVAQHPNIVPLPHAFAMARVFPQAPIILSVTGTVILESIFSAKPVSVLGEHALSRLRGTIPIGQPEQVADSLSLVLQDRARTATHREAIDLLKELHATSYDALLWDPIARPDLFQPESLQRLRNAFRHVVDGIAVRARAR